MKNAAFIGSEELIGRVYAQGRRDRAAALARVYPHLVTAGGFAEHAPHLSGTEAIFTTWGFWPLTPAQLDGLPGLEAVFYAAGSVQPFARPLLERGVRVVSAWQANAVPVAEFTLGQILLSGKGYFRNARDCRAGLPAPQAVRGPGNYGETVALLGAGAVGRALIRRLQPFDLRVVVYDPFLSAAEAQAWGVEQVSLEDAFARGFAVSNHLADKPETVRLLGRRLFERMREGATFLNTGRGATVDEADLAAVLRERPDLTALLDVSDPEPPPADSPLRALPNVHLTTHIAGALGNEVVRLADECLEEFAAWEAGRPLRGEVTLAMLDRLA